MRPFGLVGFAYYVHDQAWVVGGFFSAEYEPTRKGGGNLNIEWQ